MILNQKPLPFTNWCATCGSEDLLLCVDRTEYTPVKFQDGAWKIDSHATHTEITQGDQSVRLLCPNCGEYHNVPRALTPKPTRR